ncbi:MAG: hypothetical protein H6644_17390 [Caldilineaceae bacterium]|nr:hypothetical protein [Caldilineaceae bacterium]
MSNPIRLLELSGSPYAIGYAHGQAYADEIALLTEERMRLSSDPFWTGGRAVTHADVVAAGEACLAHHRAFSPALMEEIQGLADATGLGVNELVVMNGFTDFVDIMANPAAFAADTGEIGDGDGGGCTAFVVDPSYSGSGAGFIGQTWDMHTTATPHVLMLRITPDDGPALMTFTITGCVGMIGMNEHGVAVGINNLLGRDGRPGVHWPFVVRAMLGQRDVDAALAVLTGAQLSGAHNYVLMGPDTSGRLRGYNVEATATRQRVDRVEEYVVHTNHCVIPALTPYERKRKAYSLASTEARLHQGDAFLAAHRQRIDMQTLVALTRFHADEGPSVCAHAVPGYDVESSGACIMSPSTGELWAVWGNPCSNDYERFAVTREAALGD